MLPGSPRQVTKDNEVINIVRISNIIRNVSKSHVHQIFSWINQAKHKNPLSSALQLAICRAAILLTYCWKGTFEKSEFYYRSQISSLKNKSAHKTKEAPLNFRRTAAVQMNWPVHCAALRAQQSPPDRGHIPVITVWLLPQQHFITRILIKFELIMLKMG